MTPESRYGKSLQKQRETLADRALIAVAGIAFLFMPVWVQAFIESGYSIGDGIQLAFIVAIVPLAIFRKHLPLTIRVTALAVLILVIASLGLWLNGITSTSIPLIAAFPAVFAIVYGFRAGLAFFLFALVAFAITGTISVLFERQPQRDLETHFISAQAWIIYGASLTAIGAMSLYSVGKLYKFFERQLRDLTDQAEELDANRAEIQGILDNLVDMFVRVTPELDILIASPASERLLSIPPADMPGLSLFSFAQKPDEILAYIGDIKGSETFADLETKFDLPDGRIIWVSIALRAVRESGEIVHYEGLVRDVSARREAQRLLIAIQRSQMIGQVASGIGHDLNNHLLVVTGNLEILESSPRFGPVEQESIEAALSGAEKVQRLARKLTSTTREQEKTHTAIDINQVINETVEMFNRSTSPDLIVTTNTADGQLFARLDAGNFEDVLLNLLVNARDALTNQRQDIHVYSQRLRTDTKERKNWPDIPKKNFVLLGVKDNGVGIPASFQNEIFDAFVTTKEHAGGTGLGLAMVRSFVEQNDGLTRFESREGEGTCFEFLFPEAAEK